MLSESHVGSACVEPTCPGLISCSRCCCFPCWRVTVEPDGSSEALDSQLVSRKSREVICNAAVLNGDD
jgi:hypothetical protein